MKLNFSFKRIVSRVFLTGVIGILFGVAMFPFLTVAGEEQTYFSQKASLGQQNMVKMVALCGLFTLIVTMFTFWKKHFRMVSVLLILCWLLSLGVLGLLYVADKSSVECKRFEAYDLPPEFDRALDLIEQRMKVTENVDTIWGTVFNFRNCIDIQYSELNTELDAEGLFLMTDPTLQKLQILVKPTYKDFDDLTIATILAHELIHAGQYANSIRGVTTIDCFGDEADAFLAQIMFINQLNAEERRSIYTRLQNDITANPAFEILGDAEVLAIEATQACQELQAKNNLTTTQFNECSWTGTRNKLLALVQASPEYQAQCR